MPARSIVVDYDGTVTAEDYLDVVSMEFGDVGSLAEIEAGLDGGAGGVNDVIRREYQGVKARLDEVVEWLREHVRMRDGFADFVAQAERDGWRVLLLSSGFVELIAPILEREGLDGLEVHANAVDARPSGWVARFVDETRCGRCGEACKRRRLLQLVPSGTIVYLGDGRSDRCAAEEADHIFAVAGGGLDDYLRRRGVPHIRFRDFAEPAAWLRAYRSGAPSSSPH
ncbi:MAG: HAD-IB family phosphatase [Actinomycetia bacterium]|nr:HAD-IB family phosphatase [Actinomycetes bacterium]